VRTDFIPIIFFFVGGGVVLGYAIYAAKKGAVTLRSGTYNRSTNPAMFMWGVMLSAFLGTAFISVSFYELYLFIFSR